MIDDACTLIGERRTRFDECGNEITEPTERTVFCRIASVTRSEFYSAATASLRPELVVVLSDAADYQGESLVRYPAEVGRVYSVLRTYRGRSAATGPDSIELVLERKMGVKE